MQGHYDILVVHYVSFLVASLPSGHRGWAANTHLWTIRSQGCHGGRTWCPESSDAHLPLPNEVVSRGLSAGTSPSSPACPT